MTDAVNNPGHYTKGASESGRMALRKLGVTHFDGECLDAIERYDGRWLVSNAYAFNAAKYLWRCEHKKKLKEDLEKAVNFLNRGIAFYEKHEPNYDNAGYYIGIMEGCRDEIMRSLSYIPSDKEKVK